MDLAEKMSEVANTTPNALVVRNVLDHIDVWSGLILAFIVYGIIAGFTIFTALDLIYILIPLAQQGIDEFRDSRGLKKFLVTEDARRAIVEGYGEGKSVVGLYLRYRTKSIFIASLLLALIFSDAWYIVKDYVSRIAGAIAGFILNGM